MLPFNGRNQTSPATADPNCVHDVIRQKVAPVNVYSLLDLVADAVPDRIAVTSGSSSLTFEDLRSTVLRFAQELADAPAHGRLVLLDENSPAVPISLFAGAAAGWPYVPLNYRLTDGQLEAAVSRLTPATLIVGPNHEGRLAAPSDDLRIVTRQSVVTRTPDPHSGDFYEPAVDDDDDVAALLHTSGTSGVPKVARLRHRHLTSYVMSTVEFMGADDDEAALVSVPPYHIAGLSAILTNTFAGRRVVLLDSFDPDRWIATLHDQAITHAMVVPTMLRRIVAHLGQSGAVPGALRHLSYGGGRMPTEVIREAMRMLPDVDFVNAYGLTETSSTIALLSPQDHRRFSSSAEPAEAARLGSVGRPLPSVDVEVRDELGAVTNGVGEIYVRGQQIAGEYDGASRVDADGWFATRDAGYIDDAGYLFVLGRLDDVIVRGGENLSPQEIEDTILSLGGVADVAVVGAPDDEWGEAVVAAVVTDSDAELTEQAVQEHVRQHLRSAKVPTRVLFVAELPYNETGKLLRRTVRELVTQHV